VRELQTARERAAVLARGPVVDVPDPARSPTALPAGAEPAAGGASAPFPTLEDAERAHIREALRRSGGVIHGPRGAAALLGVKPTTLRSRMERLGLLGSRRERERPEAAGDDSAR
jgi:transcriptional regulator with GAF, ATPase, and Fis domain